MRRLLVFREVVPDEELLARWRDGDAGAGETLFERHFEPLCWFFRNKTPDHVQELVQETMLACVEIRDSRQLRCGFRAYMFAIARNKLVDHYRRRTRDEAAFDPNLVSIHDVLPTPSRIIAKDDEHRRLIEALRTLPIDTQVLLELFYWEELTGPELAVALGVPEGTVRTRLRKARMDLKSMLDEATAMPREPS